MGNKTAKFLGDLKSLVEKEEFGRRSVVKTAGWSVPVLAASVAAPSASAPPQPSSIKTTLTADAFEARINVIGEPTGNNVTITNTTSTSQISNVEVEILVSIEGRNDGDQTPLLIWTQQTPSNWSAPQDAGVATVNGRRVARECLISGGNGLV